MKLVFCGDIAIPFDTIIDYSQILSIFKDKTVIANLEGSILLDKSEEKLYRYKNKYSLYSSKNIIDVLNELQVEYVSLCNNHSLDFDIPLERNKEILSKNKINSWGYKNYDIIKIKDNNIYIITFATIACEHNFTLFSPKEILSSIKSIKKNDKDANIVIYPHWGNECSKLPEPSDRNLAHKMIDAGADIIIGHHPHVIQPIEIYKGKYIIYSCGNFILPQTTFAGQDLKYPTKEVLKELFVEYSDGKPTIYKISFDKELKKLYTDDSIELNYIDSNISSSSYLKKFIKYRGLIKYLLYCRYSNSHFGEKFCYLRRIVIKNIRNLLIKIGVHKPGKNNI